MQSTARMQAVGAGGMLMLIRPIVQSTYDSEHVWFIHKGLFFYFIFLFFLKRVVKTTVDIHDEISLHFKLIKRPSAAAAAEHSVSLENFSYIYCLLTLIAFIKTQFTCYFMLFI